MATRSPAQRSLEAEARGVLEGHKAFVQDDGSVLVKSDTHDAKRFRVTFAANMSGNLVTFTCRPEGVGAFADDHFDVTGEPGALPCKHAALAARRLEREGLAAWVRGVWVCTERAAALTEARLPAQPSDPFAGLPK
jgi:hypothetical protein